MPTVPERAAANWRQWARGHRVRDQGKRPVRLDLRSAETVVINCYKMRRPDFGLGRCAPPARRQEGADVSPMVCLDEQVGEGRMRDVGGLRCEN